MGVCDGLLMLSKNLEFITVHNKDSLSDNLAEWFTNATYEEYMEKVEGGIDVTIPVEGIPIGGGGAYSREEFEKAQELVRQGKYHKLNRQQEIEYVRKNIGAIDLAEKYVKCVTANTNSTKLGLHLSAVTNGQDIVVTVWYIPETTSERSPRLERFTIQGATFDQGFPDDLKIQPSGYSILIRRVENSPVSIIINTNKGTVTETIPVVDSLEGLGKLWLEREGGWNGIWTRQGNTNVFDARWQHHANPDVTAVLTITRAGNNIYVARRESSDGNNCDYVGTISGYEVTGTYHCDRGEPEMTWTATISND